MLFTKSFFALISQYTQGTGYAGSGMISRIKVRVLFINQDAFKFRSQIWGRNPDGELVYIPEFINNIKATS